MRRHIMRGFTPRVRATLLGCPLAMLIAMAALAPEAHAGPPAAAARPWVPATPASQDRTPSINAPINDTCAGAIVIPCGTFSLSGNTDTANNDYTFPSDASSCTGYIENGRDVVYRLNIIAGDSLWVDINSASTDVSLYVITNCASPSTSCVAGEDSTDVGGSETLRHKFTSSGTYYLVIDSFGNNSGGAWSAIGQLLCVIQPPGPTNDRCDNPLQVACGAFSYSGSTEFADNDYQYPSNGASCFGSMAQGKDVVYQLSVDAGDSLWVNFNSSTDGAVYIVSDCSDVVGTCIAGRDMVGAGQTEQLRYRFSFGGTYYMIFDSKALNSFGTWNATGEFVCPQPPKNDICEFAEPIPCGDFSLSGNTQLATDNYSFNTDAESCTGYRTGGRDVIYKVYASAGDSIWINYTSNADGAIYIATDCNNVTGTCVVGEDRAGTNETEMLRYKFTSAGVYHIFLDSFGTNTSGAWTAVGRMRCPNLAVGENLPSDRVALGAPAPNPFRTTTLIPFALPQRGAVQVRLIDLQGRRVRSLADGEFPAGQHQLRWDGRDDQGQLVRAGVYFVKLVSADGTAMRRAVYVR